MNAAFKIPSELPFFKYWWVKRQLAKYTKRADKILTQLRLTANKGNGCVDYVNDVVKYDGNHVEQVKLKEFEARYLRDVNFISNPPKEFPMSVKSVKLALVWNKRRINQLVDDVDRADWYMFNEDNLIVSLHPPEPRLDDLIKELNKNYTAALNHRAKLKDILVHTAPRKFPKYRKTVKQLIKDLK